MNKYIRKSGRYNNVPKDDESLLELIKNQWESYKESHGVYPTSQVIDMDKSMVSTKTIQRRFGSLANVRQTLGSSILNFSAGESRSDTARKCMARSFFDEIEVSNFLYLYFGKRPNVVKQETYCDTSATRADMGVYHKDGHFFVDSFSASDRYSLLGCINHKQGKIKSLDIQDTVYYVSANDEVISQETIDGVLKSKKNKLPENVKVLTYKNFQLECSNFTPR